MSARAARRRAFWLLLVVSLVTVLLVLPYALALAGQSALPAPLWAVVLGVVVNNGAVFAAALLVGLWLGPQVGLGAPEIEARLGGPRVPPDRTAPGRAIGLGIAAAAALFALDAAVFAPRLPALSAQAGTPSALQALLASFYGGIGEEVLLRLGVMTLVAWLLWKVARDTPAWLYWAAIGVAALLFGLGHLPATAALLPLTPLVIARAVLLNGIPGVAFGWLYWRHGIVAAMLSHFTADLVLHVLPALLR